MTTIEPYQSHLQRIIAVLKVDRTPSAARDHAIKMLEAGIAGAKAQVDLNLHYAKMQSEGLPSPWRESLEEFDFAAEAKKWTDYGERYERDLAYIKLDG